MAALGQPNNNASEEKKEIENDLYDTCRATDTHDVKKKLQYIEKDTFLTPEHTKMYNELRLHVDSILQRKVKWELSILPPKLLALVDPNPANMKQKEDEYKKSKNSKEAASIPKEYATEAMYKYLSSYATEATLIRAITGSDYRLEIAKVAILETVQWRVSSKVDEIKPNVFEKSIRTKVIYSMNQRDKKGHLICYFKVLETPPEDPWMIVRAAIWTIEKGVRMANQKGVYQIMWLLDIEQLKYATVPPLQILKEIAHLLQYYYPERLYRAYILYSPWVFRMVWKMVSGLLTENTKSKIIVPGWYESAKYETFQDNIDKECLDKRFGGDLDLKYSYEWEMEQYNAQDGYM